MSEKFVQVKGKKMNTYISGEGESCIVFLSGSGVSFPILEYSDFVNGLAKSNKVVMIEKFGYGLSDITDENRDVDAVIEEYRAVIKQMDIHMPVSLIAHSMGFIEALRWAQLYPSEISTLIGLDPASPEHYKSFNIEQALDGIVYMSTNDEMRAGFIESILGRLQDKHKCSEAELKRYREILEKTVANKVWISEAENLRANINLVEENGLVERPTLFFISNGEGTSLPTEIWRNHALDYLEKIEIKDYKLLDCSHTFDGADIDEIIDVINKFLTQYK